MTDETNAENPANPPGNGASPAAGEGQLPKPEASGPPEPADGAASEGSSGPASEPKPASQPETPSAEPDLGATAGGEGDQSSAAGNEAAQEPEAEPEQENRLREPFPFVRLLFSVLFGIIASFVFWIVVLLAFLQFVAIAIAGEKNEELQQFARKVASYMKQMFDYMTLASDERPFPFGPFPKE